MARGKKSGFFNFVGKLFVFGVLFGLFASYMGWLKTDTSIDINSNKAIHDTKHFIKRVSDTTKNVIDGNK